MQTAINFRDVGPSHNQFHFAVEASDLGWPPGHAPHHVDTDLGNGLPLVLLRRDAHGTLTYRQSAGCIFVTVYND